jgi:CubicO group peptidase (beta-lactamase class C family)
LRFPRIDEDAEEPMKTIPTKSATFLRMMAALVAPMLLTVAPLLGQEPVDARQMFDGAMRPQDAVNTLENSDRLFPVREIKRGGSVRALPVSKMPLQNVRFEVNGKHYDLYDYLALNRVVGLLVLKNGEIALEDYELGAGTQTRWASFSMGKSVSSTLIGAALADGAIASLDDPVTRYVPQLKNGAYDGVTVRNVIQMASGVKWDETYTDPKSDRRKLLDVQLQTKPGAILPFMSALPRAGAPGTIWNYNTGETFVVGAVLEGATHRPLATYLTEKIWSRWGMENDAKWWLESPNGMGWGGGGISATLRDFGRFGLFVLADGVIDGKRTVPAGWFDEAGSPKEVGGKMVDYGYLWWTMPKGDPVLQGAFEAIGIFGQHMYINRRANLVIVVLSARPKPTGSTVVEDRAFFTAVTKTLE